MIQAWSNPSQVVTPWATWTATWTSATNMTSVCKWRRVGEMAEFQCKATWTGAGGAGTMVLTLPSSTVPGWTAANVIDTSKIPGGTLTTNAGASYLGDGFWFDSGNGWLDLHVVYASTTTVSYSSGTQLFSGDLAANGDSINLMFSVPIVGWG